MVEGDVDKEAKGREATSKAQNETVSFLFKINQLNIPLSLLINRFLPRIQINSWHSG